MKYLAFITVLFFTVNISEAQENLLLKNTNGDLTRIANASNTNGLGGMMVYNPEKNIEGSVYLFEDWNNRGVIHTTTNQKFALKNINLNLKQNVFVSQIGQDSLFTFNMNNIEKFMINNKVFKSYYNDGENRVFQLVYEDENIEVLKGYKIQLIEGSVNPMVNRANSKYVQKQAYFFKDGDAIKPIKLRTKAIMRMANVDKTKAEHIVQHVKNNK